MKISLAPAVPYDMKRLILTGFAAVLFGVLGFLCWAILTPLDSAVVAQGTVQVVSQNKQVQHLEGGIVEQIYAQEDQLVKAGDLLLSLDSTFAGSEHQRLIMKTYELKVRASLLKAQRALQNTIVFPDGDYMGLEDEWRENQHLTAQQLFDLTRGNLQSKLSISDKRLRQLQEQLRGLDKEYVAKMQQLGFMDEEIASWKQMVEKKLANKLRFLEIQSEAAELRGVIAKIEAQKAEVQVKVSEVELEKLSAQQLYQEQAAKELRDIQFSLEDTSGSLATSKNVLGRVEIRAPVDGRITGLNVHTIGAVVKPGETLMEIVPNKDSLIVETRVNPTDIDQVFQGMTARIRVSSFKRHELPEIEGIVESVSADAFEEERSQAQYYIARVSISKFILQEMDDPSIDMSSIQPGMPTEVMIITGSSTPAQYLTEPILNAFNRAWRDG
jgi:HlyD family type I secretion membrane fusion protein